MPHDHLTTQETLEVTGLDYSSLYVWLAAGEFPRPSSFNKDTMQPFWNRKDVENWTRFIKETEGAEG